MWCTNATPANATPDNGTTVNAGLNSATLGASLGASCSARKATLHDSWQARVIVSVGTASSGKHTNGKEHPQQVRRRVHTDSKSGECSGRLWNLSARVPMMRTFRQPGGQQ